MKKIVLIAVGVMTGSCVFGMEPEMTGTPTMLREHLSGLPGQVTISGIAERRVESDRAVVKVVVRTSDHKLQPALENNRRIRADVVKKLAESGLDKDRVHTSRFSSTPVHSSWSKKVKEYHIESTIRVHAESENEVEVLAGLVDSIDEMSLSSLSFEMTKKDDITIELMKAAFDKIEMRKKMYESSLGVTLVPKQIGQTASKPGNRRNRFLNDYAADTSFAGVLTNPELTVTLHALQQRAPEDLNQFEELLYKVDMVVTFDVFQAE
jgi:uncharacterized protein YggE